MNEIPLLIVLNNKNLKKYIYIYQTSDAHMEWTVSLVIANGHFHLQDFCGYVWAVCLCVEKGSG